MTRTAALLVSLLLTLPPAWGLDQKFLEPTVPTSPSLKAQGGVSTANATGWDGLWANPASLADPTPSLTFSSFEVTGNLPLSAVSRILAARNSWTNTDYLDASNPMVELVNDVLTRSGAGAEVNWGLGWAGQNLGVGLNTNVRSFAKGKSLLGADIDGDATIQGAVGLGWPFDVGLGSLKLGLTVRPEQKYLLRSNVSGILEAANDLSSLVVSSGFGLGWDLGARWDYAGFRTGLVIRDAGSTVFSFKDYSAAAFQSNPLAPAGGTSNGTTLYRIPTVIGLGTSWTPDLGSLESLVKPTVSVDFQIPIKDEYTQPSFFTWTHLGVEAELLNFLAVRTGLNQGYFTFGLGAHVAFLELNAAVYADELGRYSGLNRRSGLAFELAFRL